MLRNKIITTTGKVLVGGVAVTVGTLAAVAMLGVATTSKTGRIVYSALAYFVAASISEKATETIVEPIVELLKTEEHE